MRTRRQVGQPKLDEQTDRHALNCDRQGRVDAESQAGGESERLIDKWLGDSRQRLRNGAAGDDLVKIGNRNEARMPIRANASRTPPGPLWESTMPHVMKRQVSVLPPIAIILK
jgi:hypothetical protein